LWKGLNSVNGANLTEAANNLATTLKEFASDHKLQKALTAFINENA
jgi:ribosomal protein S15P/S13E